MPTQTEFKFDCSACGQHILVAAEWSGRQIDCPSCQTKLTIPAPPKAPRKPASVMPPNPVTHPNYTSQPVRVAVAAKDKKPVATQKPGTPATPKTEPIATGPDKKAKAGTIPPPPVERLRIATLTPTIKLEIVRSVRRRIAEESAWLPARLDGVVAYAAKVSNGKNVPVDVKSSEATRFSLIGAFLLEFHLQNVIRTAAGRTRLLDQEIPDAVTEVMAENVDEEQRERTEDTPTEENLARSSHAQCLAALALLAERYSRRMDQARAEKAKRKLGTTRLPDLVKKLERKDPVAAEDVATALYHELMEVRHRLDRLESRTSGEK